jgi:hypothetical protein
MESDNEIKKLIATRANNNKVAWLLSDYVNNCPKAITSSMIEELSQGNDLPKEVLYQILFNNICGIDAEQDDESRFLADKYLRYAVTHLNADLYKNNQYYSDIHIPDKSFGRWELTSDHYSPYEAFVYKDITLQEDYTEIPHIGYFDEDFSFPIVKENNREWMAIKPNEIETMKDILDKVKGQIVTFGLGLGYFTYMASIKKEVESITVIEKDNDIITLFKQYILPQFKCKDKIKIIQCDAFDYLKNNLPQEKYEYAFIDLWHDVSDGLDIYLKIKKQEKSIPQTRFYYWVENSILSALRWQVFDIIIKRFSNINEVKYYLSDEALRKLAAGTLNLT